MAGQARPSQCINSVESKYVVIGGRCYAGTVTDSWCPMFDGDYSGTWNTSNSFYFDDSYLEVELKDQTRIWAYGVYSYNDWNGALTIYKKENDSYINVSDKYKQLRVNENPGDWYVLYEELPAGIYKFTSSYRIDFEWFFENLFPSKLLLKKNDKYMTIIDGNLVEYTGDINTFDTATVTNANDFIPFIDNIENNNYQLISKKPFKATINGIKYDKSMICTLEPISMKKFKTIHSITGDYTIKNNGVIKLLFSFDKGTTWKTYDVNNATWNDVSVTIPIKLYENFSDDDKTNWDNAKTTILSDGVDVQNLGNVNFQIEKTKNLMFAVAFNRPAYADTCTLKGLNINYDGLETYTQLACGSDLSKYEARVSITGDSVEVKTASNQDKILVTMTTNI